MRLYLLWFREAGYFLRWSSPSWFRRGWRGWFVGYHDGNYERTFTLLGFTWIKEHHPLETIRRIEKL